MTNVNQKEAHIKQHSMILLFFGVFFVFFIGTYNNFRIKRRDNLNETNFVDQYVKTTKENTFVEKEIRCMILFSLHTVFKVLHI